MYKNCSLVADKSIVGCPLGARNCPYTRQIDNKYRKHLPHTMHWANVTIPGNPHKKEMIIRQKRMHL
eukprot:12994252-Ditylum_brightwellii.AAC.1